MKGLPDKLNNAMQQAYADTVFSPEAYQVHHRVAEIGEMAKRELNHIIGDLGLSGISFEDVNNGDVTLASTPQHSSAKSQGIT